MYGRDLVADVYGLEPITFRRFGVFALNLPDDSATVRAAVRDERDRRAALGRWAPKPAAAVTSVAAMVVAAQQQK